MRRIYVEKGTEHFDIGEDDQLLSIDGSYWIALPGAAESTHGRRQLYVRLAPNGTPVEVYATSGQWRTLVYPFGECVAWKDGGVLIDWATVYCYRRDGDRPGPWQKGIQAR